MVLVGALEAKTLGGAQSRKVDSMARCWTGVAEGTFLYFHPRAGIKSLLGLTAVGICSAWEVKLPVLWHLVALVAPGCWGRAIWSESPGPAEGSAGHVQELFRAACDA